MIKISTLKQSALAVLISLALTACGGGGASNDPISLENEETGLELSAAVSTPTAYTDDSVIVSTSASLTNTLQVTSTEQTEAISVPEIKPDPETIPEPVAEPEPQPIPEPVAEPEPQSIPEPVAEPEPQSIPEPVAEPEPQSIPEPVAEPEPEAKPALVAEAETKPELEPVQSEYSSIILGAQPGDAQCIDLNGVEREFGELTRDDWKSWVPDLRYTLSEENLSVEQADGNTYVLRQQFVPTDNGSDRVLMASNLKQHRTYRVMTSVFLEPGWDWGGEVSQGGKIAFGVGGGSVPSGGTVDPSGFTARLMWRGAQDGSAKMGIYSYAADRPKKYGEDNLFKDDARIGEWMDIIYEIKLNSSVNTSDGSMRAWVDGELVLDRQNVGWQLDGNSPVIDTLYYSSFYGGSTNAWSPDRTTHAKFKNICWAPVVDGYSGIDPDNGRILVDSTVNPQPIFADDPFNGQTPPTWYLEREEILVQVETSRELVQQVSPLASLVAQFYFDESVHKLYEILNIFKNIHSASISHNPLPALHEVLTNLDSAKALSTTSPSQIRKIEVIEELLQASMVNSAELAVAVAHSVRSQLGCDELMDEGCIEGDLQIAEAESYRDQMQGVDNATLFVLAELAWNTSVNAVNTLQNGR